MKMRAFNLSETKVGKVLGLDGPATHRLFRGARRLQLDEVPKLAQTFLATQTEILTAFGLDLSAEGKPGASKLTLSGVVDGSLTAHLGESFVKGAKTVRNPFGDKDLRGLRLETASSPYAWLDGRIVFYRGSQIQGTELAGMIGQLGLVQLKGREDWLLRVLRRGYAGVGFYTLEDFSGKPLETDVRVEAAREILWIRYS